MEQVDTLCDVCLQRCTAGLSPFKTYLWMRCSRIIGYIKRKMGTT